jgi:hypothetical protein
MWWDIRSRDGAGLCFGSRDEQWWTWEKKRACDAGLILPSFDLHFSIMLRVVAYSEIWISYSSIVLYIVFGYRLVAYSEIFMMYMWWSQEKYMVVFLSCAYYGGTFVCREFEMSCPILPKC